jgi:hypothetical protein
VNLCGPCARLASVETSEALAIDAMENAPPAVWVVLTTRTAESKPAPFYEARWAVMRAIKRRWPDAEYAALVEFTTGYGPRSGGRRRPHWNLLLKHVPADSVDELREVVVRVWCSRVDAKPGGQFVGQVAEVGGLMRYLALHFQKQSQAPPLGWRGHRFMHSRGYFPAGIEDVRSRAREQLRRRREYWKLERLVDEWGEPLLLPYEIEEMAEANHAANAALSWELVQVEPLAAAPRADVVRQDWAALRGHCAAS